MSRIPVLVILCMLLLSSVGYLGCSADKNVSSVPVLNPASYDKGYRYNIQGWIYVYIQGDAYERGYQHGYLLAAEIVDMLNRWSYMIHHYPKIERISPRFSDERFDRLAERWWDFCVNNCYRMYWDLFPVEYQREIQGIADGVTARGGQIHGSNVSFKDILAMNEMYEFMSKLTKIPKAVHPLRTFFHQLEQEFPEFSKLSINGLLDGFLSQDPAHHCNGFIATGNATTHGQMVFTHSTICGGGMWWWTYFISLRWNVLLDIHPTKGNRVMVSTSPGLIWSDEDYYQNDNGIVLLETTLPQGLFDNKGLPLSVRARNAMQYGNTIDDVIRYLKNRNDGSMNAVWLIGDSKTGEIARFELGYRASAIYRTMDGFYWSANNPYDVGVRLEKFNMRKYIEKLAWKLVGISGYGFFSPLYHAEARDLKYEELGDKYYGQIDVDVVKEISMTSPISDWITDIKITDTGLLSQNGLWLFWGNPWKSLNISQFDTRNQSVEGVPPSGWVQVFGVPEKNNFSLITQHSENKNTTKVLWTASIGNQTNDFYCIGTVSDDVVYEAASDAVLVALNVTNGKLLWKKDIGKNPIQPVVYSDYIFVGCEDGVHVFTIDGKKQWLFSCEPVCSSPVVYEDQVFIGTGDGTVYCVSVAEGKHQWNLSLPGPVYLGIAENNTVYLSSNMSCYAVDRINHSIQWRFDTKGIITASPVVVDAMVFVGSWDTFMYCLDRVTGVLIWKYDAGWGFDTSPVVDDRFVFCASVDNNLYALDQKTGVLEWFFTGNAAFHGQPCVYGDFVFAGCDDGKYYAVNRSTGKIAWLYAFGETIENGSLKNYITTPVRSNPVVVDGKVVCGALGSVVSLDAQTFVPENIPPSPPEPPEEDDEEPDDENPDENHDDEPGFPDGAEGGSDSQNTDYSFIFLVVGIVCVVIIFGFIVRRWRR